MDVGGPYNGSPIIDRFCMGAVPNLALATLMMMMMMMMMMMVFEAFPGAQWGNPEVSCKFRLAIAIFLCRASELLRALGLIYEVYLGLIPEPSLRLFRHCRDVVDAPTLGCVVHGASYILLLY